MTADFGINQGLVEELYLDFLRNPRSVDPGWRTFFESRGNGQAAIAVAPLLPRDEATARRDGGRLHQLVTAYRFLGHLGADFDPLHPREGWPKELDYRTYGFEEADLERVYSTVDLPGPGERTLGEVVDLLADTYCGAIGVEFRSIEDTDERHWLQERMESTQNHQRLDRDEQIHLLTKLTDAENLEQFIASSYAPGTKRFSLEGGESVIPLCDVIIERGALHGMEELVIGMAHRGRLNVLANTLEMQLKDIFYAFEDKDAERYLGRGDVKYHLGFESRRVTRAGREVHLELAFNPSHLEFVNPVVEGLVRARQDRARDTDRTKIVPLLIHGDAAFVGQGVVAETLNLTKLRGYTTGGTIHLIVNNQIGFTTDPPDSRSTRYASDILRMLNVPVFHVNGEDPEAVTQVATLAVEYRQRFNKDVLIDLYCYRRHGHNEGDEPRFTQPGMYQLIDQKPTVREMYVKRLVALGQIDQALADAIARERRKVLEVALEQVKREGFRSPPPATGGIWEGYRGGWDSECPEVDTGVDRERLIALSQAINSVPEHFHAHKKIAALLQQRHKRLAGGAPFDWGTAELLAYASLLSEGADIRLSGEDVGRGTFSHRHAVLFDQETGFAHVPLNHLAEQDGPAGQHGGRFEAINSPLSEAAVLGFDFGYSLDAPDKLVIWEAQFGDFLNAAQVIVDQFITSCEDKWMRLSGLTLYLPHGYEGQGPEHSSARIERFLQNSAEDNIQVCNVTTPAQLFHLLRRQIRRPYRKPLVLFTPKSLLRAAYSAKGPKPVSTIDDLASGRFRRVLPDDVVEAQRARKILLCSGKIYYDLARRRFERGIDDVAIVRIEQLYPFNDELPAALERYRGDTRLSWVQEEPWNSGAWFYINACLSNVIGRRLPLSCVARERSASPATGSKASHELEQAMLVDEAFS